jgi:hypothetical protein
MATLNYVISSIFDPDHYSNASSFLCATSARPHPHARALCLRGSHAVGGELRVFRPPRPSACRCTRSPARPPAEGTVMRRTHSCSYDTSISLKSQPRLGARPIRKPLTSRFYTTSSLVQSVCAQACPRAHGMPSPAVRRIAPLLVRVGAPLPRVRGAPDPNALVSIAPAARASGARQRAAAKQASARFSLRSVNSWQPTNPSTRVFVGAGKPHHDPVTLPTPCAAWRYWSVRESAQLWRKALGWIMQLLPSSLKEDTLRSLPAKRVLYKVRGGLSRWRRSALFSGSPGLTPQRDSHAFTRPPDSCALHVGAPRRPLCRPLSPAPTYCCAWLWCMRAQDARMHADTHTKHASTV